MLCDLCHKEEAIIHWTVLINNQKTDLHLCESCAIKRGLITPGGMKFKELFPLIPRGAENIKCRNCGLSVDEFRNTAKLGCAQCYIDFKKFLVPLLRHIHGSAEHIGKVIPSQQETPAQKQITPSKSKPGYEVKKAYAILKQKLKDAIADESYEEAARIRDEIKKLGIDEN